MIRGGELQESILLCNHDDDKITFWWLGQLGYVIRMAGCTIYADAYLTDDEPRLFPPLLQAEDITDADIVLGTHDHIDHIDHPAWKAIAKASPQAVFVVPKLLTEDLAAELEIPVERFVGIDDGMSCKVKGITIHGIAAAHEKLDRDPVTGQYPYMSYVLEGNGRKIYHAGDTCVYEGMLTKIRALAPIDVMFVPINGRDARRLTNNCIGNMTFQEAVDLCGEVAPALAVPGHYDMFCNNLGSPLEFKAYLEAKYPGIPCWIGEHGAKVEV